MTRLFAILGFIALSLPAPSSASTPRAYAALDRQSAAACIAASRLRNATISPATRFSDRFGMDARTVTGIYPQAHMQGASGTMLCLYNRQTRRVETQELMSSAPIVASAEIKDVWWRATDIDNNPVGSSDVTLMFGSDGKVGGRSACNNYSSNYMLTGTDLRVYPGMIGTRMACRPPVLAQESQFRDLLGAATSATLQTDGVMVVTSPNNRTIRFVRASTRPN